MTEVPRPAGAGIRPLLTPEEIALRSAEQAPFLRLPVPSTQFAERAARLRTLATGHAMGEYLTFIAQLADAQHRTVARARQWALPTPQALREAAEQIEPPLRPSRWPRDPAWIDMLRDVLRDVQAQVSQPAARTMIERLAAAPAQAIETQADRILNGIALGLDTGSAPLIAAGLQVYWSTLVAQIVARDGPSVFGRVAVGSACPCCGAAPTASIVRIGGAEAGYRYLQCSLCATQWHVVRIKCAHCESTQGIHLESLSEDESVGTNSAGRTLGEAIRAECCDTCRHYLKVAYMDKDLRVDPVADDLATIMLDLLLAESEYRPAGLNLMLWYGDSEPD